MDYTPKQTDEQTDFIKLSINNPSLMGKYFIH